MTLYTFFFIFCNKKGLFILWNHANKMTEGNEPSFLLQIRLGCCSSSTIQLLELHLLLNCCIFSLLSSLAACDQIVAVGFAELDKYSMEKCNCTTILHNCKRSWSMHQIIQSVCNVEWQMGEDRVKLQIIALSKHWFITLRALCWYSGYAGLQSCVLWYFKWRNICANMICRY